MQVKMSLNLTGDGRGKIPLLGAYLPKFHQCTKSQLTQQAGKGSALWSHQPCMQRYGGGHGTQHVSESPDVGMAWEEEGQQLPTTCEMCRGRSSSMFPKSSFCFKMQRMQQKCSRRSVTSTNIGRNQIWLQTFLFSFLLAAFLREGNLS